MILLIETDAAVQVIVNWQLSMQQTRNAYKPRVQSSGVGLEERCALSHGANFNRPASTSVHLQINNQCGVNFVEIEHDYDSNGSILIFINHN